jgi:hypothetical protein
LGTAKNGGQRFVLQEGGHGLRLLPAQFTQSKPAQPAIDNVIRIVDVTVAN